MPCIGNRIINWRISDVKNNWRAARSNIAPNYGDYIHGVSVGDVLHALWADSRNDNTPSPFSADRWVRRRTSPLPFTNSATCSFPENEPRAPAWFLSLCGSQ